MPPDPLRTLNGSDALTLNLADFPSNMYLARCEHLKMSPPRGDWNGVWVMESK